MAARGLTDSTRALPAAATPALTEVRVARSPQPTGTTERQSRAPDARTGDAFLHTVLDKKLRTAARRWICCRRPDCGSIQISGLYRPDMSVRVDDGVTQALVTGTVGSRPQVYALAGEAGQKLEAALAAPPGVSLEVRHGDEVLYVGHEEPRRLATTLARGGDLALSVTSSDGESGEYGLTITIWSALIRNGPHPLHRPERPRASSQATWSPHLR